MPKEGMHIEALDILSYKSKHKASTSTFLEGHQTVILMLIVALLFVSSLHTMQAPILVDTASGLHFAG